MFNYNYVLPFYLHSTTSGRRILKNLSISFRVWVSGPEVFLGPTIMQFCLNTVVPLVFCSLCVFTECVFCNSALV